MIDFGAALDEPRPIEPEVVEREPVEVVTSAMDAESVRRALARYDSDIAEMKKQAKAAVVADDATKKVVVAMTGRAKTLVKAIETVRKAAVDPPNDYVKCVNSLCKGYQKKFQDIADDLTGKCTIYDRDQEDKRREAERIAQDAARKIQEEARKAGVPAEDVPEIKVVLPKAPTVTRTEDGSSYTRVDWKYEITDVSALPREYLIPHESLINRAVKAGVRVIPGVRIYQEQSTRIRT